MKIYEAMRDEPQYQGTGLSKWKKNNFEKVNLDLREEDIRVMDVDQYKTLIETVVREEAFKDVKNIQANHEKCKDTMKTQKHHNHTWLQII